jgi:peptidoglycan/xylan/chitin deacetylase (PgdA/CDA1 family)
VTGPRRARGLHALAAITIVLIGVALALAVTGSGRPRAKRAAVPPTEPTTTGTPPPTTTRIPPSPPTTTQIVPPPTTTEIPPPATTVQNPPEHPVTRLDHFVDAGRPLYCGGTRRPLVALTFDDGPGPHTGALLDLLRRRHAQATFFLVGDRIRYWPQLAAREAKVGVVGNHTWSHALLPGLRPRRVAAQIDEATAAITRATGDAVRLFRPPYEAHTPAIDRGIRARGMLEVLWNVDGGDYLPGRSAKAIANGVMAHVRRGSIVLLHDIQPRTVRAVRLLLPRLRRRGLRPVTIPELIRLDPPPASSRACES